MNCDDIKPIIEDDASFEVKHQRLLNVILEKTQSELGMISVYNQNMLVWPAMFKINSKFDSICNHNLNETGDYYVQKNLDNILGKVLKKEDGPYIVNKLLTPTNSKMPDDHPHLNNFIGYRLFHNQSVVGMVTLSGSDNPYQADLLSPEVIRLLSEFIYYIKHIDMINKKDAKRYHNLFHHSFNLNCFSREGMFLAINQSWIDLLGYTEEELLTTPYIEFIHPDDRIATTEKADGLEKNYLNVHEFENRYITKSGDVVNLLWKAIVYKDDLDENGRPLIIATASDITKIKLYQKQLIEAHIEKDSYLSRVSHELRTPMNSILGFSQIMDLNNNLSIEDRENLKLIIRASKYLLNLINEVLEISQVESGNASFSIEDVLIDDIIDETISIIKSQAEKFNITIIISNSHYGTYVRADKQRLIQVLLNLMSNAIKYNKVGGDVTIVTFINCSNCQEQKYCSCETPKSLVVEIADQGLGIPPELVDKLFHPFERLEKEKSNVEGTGLGLALSKKLIDKMNGKIYFKSSCPEKTIFAFEIPLVPRVLKYTDQNATIKIGQSNINKVLFIEDNLNNYKLMEKIIKLSNKQIKSFHFQQGNLGYDSTLTTIFKIIFIDLNLPDIHGIDVIRKIRNNPHNINRKTPIYVVSADAVKDHQKEAIAAGATDYVLKPVDVSDILNKFNKHLTNL